MIEIPGSFEFGGLLCFPRPASLHSYYFLPLHADVDRDGSGRPMSSLIVTGDTGFLMFTAVWRAAETDVEALRAELAARDQVDATNISLAFAPVQVTRCDLLLEDGSGQWQTLSSRTTSGFPPYSTLFNVMPTREQFPNVAAALNGRVDVMAVEYDAGLKIPVEATGRLAPQSTELIPWLRDYLSDNPAAFRSAIEEAIEDELAMVQISLTKVPAGDLITRLYESVLARAAELLPRIIQAWDPGAPLDFEVAVTLSEETAILLRPRADLSLLRGTGQGGLPIPIPIPIPGGSEALASRPLRVELDFDPEGAPLAWVRLRWGRSEAVLREPRFTAELPVDRTSGQLVVTAGYTNGAGAYKSAIDPPSEGGLVLTPSDLGLRVYTVDARPLAQAGARAAEVWLRHKAPYRPGQTKSIQFREEAWIAQWWVATPAGSAPGDVEGQWTATGAAGRLAGQFTQRLGSSDTILLTPEG